MDNLFYKPANENQIPLFGQQETLMSEGYRCLSAFMFEKAENFFSEAIQTGMEKNEEAANALEICEYWHPLISKNGKEPLSSCANTLYTHFKNYRFTNKPGHRQFKTALLHHIAQQMFEANNFYIGEDETISDMLLELNLFKKAERVVLQQMEQYPGDYKLYYYLGQVQWRNGLKGAAKKNYALALLHDPCRASFNRIEYKNLHSLIDTEGPEMAPAFGWVRGILPLVPLRDETKPCSEGHQRAMEIYQLLRLADKALAKRDTDACFEYRKQLKELAPALYEEYFALLSS